MSKSAPPPEKIIVSGAGIPEFNGEYCLSSAKGKDGSPTYEMEGTWKGKPETYQIFYHHIKENTSVYKWWIVWTSSLGVNYFSNPGTTPDMPPRRGWWDNPNPTGGPPILSFDDEPSVLDWRQEDPDDNLSDFALEIVSTNPETQGLVTKTYNVHKAILAKTSEYFAALFRDTKKRKRSDHGATKLSNRITLPELAASMVPYLLDILYGISNNGMSVQDPTNHQRIIGLYFLADYFQIPCLCLELLRIVKDRVTSYSCSLFLSAALELGIEVIVAECVQCCSKNILEMEFDEKTTDEDDTSDDEDEESDSDALVAAANVAFLLRVFQAADMTEERSRKASEFVAAFCDEHVVEADDFKSLTDSTILPHVDARVAWSLLKKEAALLGGIQEQLANDTLSSLQERCIDGLVHDFLHSDGSAFDEESFDAQPSLFASQYVKKMHAQKKSTIQAEPHDENE
jgi:hypothetical protein